MKKLLCWCDWPMGGTPHEPPIAYANDIPDFRQMEAELLSDGWEHGAPLGADVDAEIVEQGVPCHTCGAPLTFVPFRRRGGRGYRAFAVCRACNSGSEF